MAARLIGTDSADPKLPTGVINASKAKTAPSGGIVVHDVLPVNVAQYGHTRVDVIAALDAAEARGVGTVVYFPGGPTPYEFGAGISMSGRTSQIRGDGVGGSTASPRGTVFKATTQSGPVLDFSGYLQPDAFKGRVTHGGFRIVGSGVADATKANSGVRLVQMGSANFMDIVIEETGGPCWAHTGPSAAVYLNDFERIVCVTPVSAAANDVPYVHMLASNGNRFRGWGLRSVTSGADTGVSGAVILEDDGTTTPHDNLFDAWWVEFLHLSTDGTVFSLAGNSNVLSNVQWFDTTKVVGQTNTSHIKLLAPDDDFGGNQVLGYIPGRGTSTNNIDWGVDVYQSRNSIRGVKGYKGYNVRINSGVIDTDVELSGASASATDIAVQDDSANTDNRYVDHYLRTERRIVRTLYTTTGSNTVWTTRPVSLIGAHIFIMGGGQAGGSGRRGAAGTVRGGGGAGAPGAFAEGWFSADDLPSGSFTFTLPAAAVGGAAVTANDTNGNPGALAGDFIVGPLRVVNGSVAAGGGTTVGGTAGAAATNGWGVVGPAGSVGGVGAATPAGTANLNNSACGGGPGAGISAVEAVAAGAAGGAVATRTGLVRVSVPAAGTAGAVNGGNGGAGNNPTNTLERTGGTGGGGGGSDPTAAGGNGAKGGRGAGGGGGAASTNGANSGAGGDGGDPFVIITEHHVV